MLDGKTCIYVISKGCEFHLFPWQRCTEKAICGKVCQSLVDVWWDYFRTSVSSINKTYHHNVTQMWIKIVSTVQHAYSIKKLQKKNSDRMKLMKQAYLL
jgi:hypothetical protein